jgi:DNA-binding transcriptional MerR regulator
MPQVARSFEIQEFAKLAGVTVRALQHYDRMGLLKPARSRGGSRIYRESDLQALVQIMALKSVGVPLKRIGILRAGGATALLQTLGRQRRALERRQPVVDRMIFAVRTVEAALGRGEEADPTLLKPLVEALRPENDAVGGTSENGGQSSAASAVHEAVSAWEPLEQQWLGLLQDLQASAGHDPAGPPAQALAARWERLMALSTGGGSLRKLLAPRAGELAGMPSGPVPAGTFEKIGPALGRFLASDR